MLRPRSLATVLALALLAGALYYAPIGSGQSGEPKLSPTPPVTLAPAPTAPTAPPSAVARPKLPKTGFETWLVALIGFTMVVAGTALRTRRRFATELLTVVGVGLVVAGTVLEPRTRPASRRRR